LRRIKSKKVKPNKNLKDKTKQPNKKEKNPFQFLNLKCYFLELYAQNRRTFAQANKCNIEFCHYRKTGILVTILTILQPNPLFVNCLMKNIY
jgi:hypothetical protein